MNARSLDITVYLEKHIDRKNFLNYESSIQGRRRDVVALGMSKSKLMYVNLEESNPLGIVCSDNWWSPSNLEASEKDTFKLKCDTVPFLTQSLTSNV